MGRARLRDLGITIGELPTGPYNAITDVPGVWVGHTTLIYDEPRVARTGVTVIRPRAGEIYADQCFAGYHSFNGNGEMTGLLWLDEAGQLGSPIAITNTHQVGVVRDALVDYEARQASGRAWLLPVVAETYDGWLNDINALSPDPRSCLCCAWNAARRAGGGGQCRRRHGDDLPRLQGGHRHLLAQVVEVMGEPYTVGVLVQANYGDRRDLRVDGVPVGRAHPEPKWRLCPAQLSQAQARSSSSWPRTRPAARPVQPPGSAGNGRPGRVGGIGHNGSGDIFLAFATGNHLSHDSEQPVPLQLIPNRFMNPLFYATVEAVEESILNAMAAAETMTGFRGRTVHALPLDELQRIWHAI